MPGSGSVIKEQFLVWKTVHTDTASDNTVNDDPHLQFSIAANESIFLTSLLHISAGAGGFRFTLNGPAGFTTILYRNMILPNAGNCLVAGSAAAWGIELVLAGAIIGIGRQFLYFVNGVNPGTIIVRWAQEAVNVANTSLFNGSYLHVLRV